MNLYVTSYYVDGCKYGSYIVANTQEEAEMLALVRNIGEVIEGIRDFWHHSDFSYINIHYLILEVTYASYIALESQLKTPVKIVGNGGILYKLSKIACGIHIHEIDTLHNEIVQLFKMLALPYDENSIYEALIPEYYASKK